MQASDSCPLITISRGKDSDMFSVPRKAAEHEQFAHDMLNSIWKQSVSKKEKTKKLLC